MDIRLAGIVEESIVDGPGIRFVIFTQGCPHHCEGCHNPDTHSFDGGYLENIDNIINKFKRYPYGTGLTISGGEPFVQPNEVLNLILEYKKLYPRKNIMMYTGYLFEELLLSTNCAVQKILKSIDYLVDGKFELSLRDISLVFKGSSNQRIIDVKNTLISNEIKTINF